VHNNYYFLRQLTKQLDSTLSNAVVSECFSQNKEEIVIRLETKNSSLFVKASLQPHFSCLSFPKNFQRAKKNSIDLFDSIVGQTVRAVHQFENERSFTVQLTNEFDLLFKMHGNRSNLVLFQQGVAKELFKTNMADDISLDLENLDRNIDWSEENFIKHHTRPEIIYFTFGKPVWRYLNANGFHELPLHDQWQAILVVRESLEHPDFFYIQELEDKVIFSLLELGKTIKQLKDAAEAITEFFHYYTQQEAFVREKTSALSFLKSKLHASQSYLKKTKAKLLSLEHNDYKVWADLIMANLHLISPGSDRVTVPDFYHDNRATEIKLKKDLTPQKNAANFYKKAKNQQIEISHLQKLADAKAKEIDSISNQIQEIELQEDLKSLRKLTQNANLSTKENKQIVALPYREVEFKNFRILIGKNAQSNDLLTLKYGYKEDLFLHAKDVAGSHVLVKYQSGKNFPRDVVERAAQLAAYYSKRKNDSLCPVVVTPRKFVRKRKGDPAGAVVVAREEVVMVEPRGL
jgi:predicted ribosome quality control (RQC) complex YloA/Tae2 family protein